MGVAAVPGVGLLGGMVFTDDELGVELGFEDRLDVKGDATSS